MSREQDPSFFTDKGDALGKESRWNEAACNPDTSHHKIAFSLIFGT
jgi:hypothetical protein